MNGRFIDGVFLLNSDQSYSQPRTSSPVLMHLYEQAGIQIAWSGGATIAVDTATDTDVNTTANTITLTGHVFETGLKVGVSSTGTLPAPLSATDYYVIKVDGNTIKLATSMANAVAGSAVDLSTAGTVAATISFTPAATAGTFAIEASNNYSAAYGTGTWSALTFSPSLTAVSGASGDFLVTLSVYPYSWIRLVYTPTAGDCDIVATISAKG